MDALPESLPKKFLPQEKVKNTIREFLSWYLARYATCIFK
jgi:hypothetical protein